MRRRKGSGEDGGHVTVSRTEQSKRVRGELEAMGAGQRRGDDGLGGVYGSVRKEQAKVKECDGEELSVEALVAERTGSEAGELAVSLVVRRSGGRELEAAAVDATQRRWHGLGLVAVMTARE